ncbi:MAG: ABC transporter substrate-binding protein [Pseudomonadota bacterium]
MPRSTPRLLATAVLLVAVLMMIVAQTLCLMGCGGGECPPGYVRLALETDPLNLDPRLSIDAASARVGQLLYNGLLRLDQHGNLGCDLASDWHLEGDRTYIVRLREGVRFHDGRILNAQDVVHTFRSILDPALASPRREGLSHLRGVEATGPLTVRFTLKEPYAPFTDELMQPIVPRDAGKKNSFGQHPVGTGPYRLVRWLPGERLDLAAFGGHFARTPKVPGLAVRIIPDDTTRVLEIQRGGLDFVQNLVPPDMVSLIEAGRQCRVIKVPGNIYCYMGFNLEDPVLANPKVRRAIAHVLDRHGMIRHLLAGLARPAAGLLPPEHWASEPNVRRYAYDPALAERLLNEAGFRRDALGWRFTLLYKTTQMDMSKRKAELIQDQLARVGIRVEIRSYEWATFFADIQHGSFQLFSLDWVGLSDPDIFRHLFSSKAIPPDGANRGRYQNPLVDRLLEEGRASLDRGLRQDIYRRVQRIVAEELPYLSLWHYTNVIVMNRDLHGFTPYPDGSWYSMKDLRWGA